MHCDLLQDESGFDEAVLLRMLVDLEERTGEKMVASLADSKRFLKLIEEPILLEKLIIVPLKKIPLRVSKYDVVLRAQPLHAVRAMHTILTSMVMFRCWTCNERFPAYHPAFTPPQELSLELRKCGHSGVASCDVEVGQWDEVPPLFKSGNAPLIAGSFTGMCKRCQRDIDSQRSSLSPGDAQAFVAIDDVVPKRSFKNCMDPCWTFPHHELADLFRHATTTEAMLVALEHMQMRNLLASFLDLIKSYQ